MLWLHEVLQLLYVCRKSEVYDFDGYWFEIP